MRAAAFLLALLAWCPARPEFSSPARAQKPPADRALPPGVLLRLGSENLRHPYAQAVVYSPDGTVLATGGKDVRLWDARTRRLLRTIPLPDRQEGDSVNRLQFTADGKTLYALSFSGGSVSVRAFAVPSGKPLVRFRPQGLESTTAFALSPDGRTLATGSRAPRAAGDYKGELNLWKVGTKEKPRALPGHQRTLPIPLEFNTFLMIESAAFSPDGKWLASLSGHQDDAVRVFEVATGKQKYALRRHPHVQGGRLVFSPEGYLAVVTALQPPGPNQQPVLTLWDLKTGKIQSEIAGLPGWHAITFSPDGKWLAAGVAANDRVCVWERATRKVRFTTPRFHPAYAMAFSRDGHTLVTCSGSTALAIWDLKNSRDVLGDDGHTGAISALDVSADGRTVASAGKDGIVFLWDARTGKGRRLFQGNGSGGMSVAFSPNGRTVATSAYLSDVIVWDVASGKELRRFPDGDNIGGSRVGFSPDGKTLAVVSSGLEYRFFDAATGQEQRRFSWYRGGGIPTGHLPLRHVPFRFSPDGKHFAGLYAAQQGQFAVALWDLSKQAPQVVSPETDHVADIAFSPDGEYLAWSDRDHVHVWDMRAGRKLKSLKNEPPSGCLAFTPDGRYLANGKKLHPLDPKHRPLELPIQPGHLAFSRGGGILVAVPQDGCTVLVIDPKKLAR
jgi:WD40 repeat protein